MKRQLSNLVPPGRKKTAPTELPDAQFRAKPGVLVVDDDHLVRIMVQLGLERNGFEVWQASSGCEAIEVFRENTGAINVVVLDVCMPDLDGPHTLAALRTLDPGVAACFMTADSGAYDIEDLRQRCNGHVFVKPFLLNEMACVLRSFGESSEWQSSSVQLTVGS